MRASLPLSNRHLRAVPMSAEYARARSRGEITKPETINYRTFAPEKQGLFCAEIFGGLSRCPCGSEPIREAWKRTVLHEAPCTVCGAIPPVQKGRRRRFGHIGFACALAHPFFRPELAAAAGLEVESLESVLYGERFLLMREGRATVVGEAETFDEPAGGAATGGDAIEAILPESSRALMIRTLLVLPPAFRSMVPLDAGRFATSDVNDLYRRVVNRNNRLRRLKELNAPEIIIRNEVRMLQEAVDALFDNERGEKVITGPDRRTLRSLLGLMRGSDGVRTFLTRFDDAIGAGEVSLKKPGRFRAGVDKLRALALVLEPS